MQKHARSKCAVFAPLLRAVFRNFFANHFPFGIVTITEFNDFVESGLVEYQFQGGKSDKLLTHVTQRAFGHLRRRKLICVMYDYNCEKNKKQKYASQKSP
jgi:hypothetical protein